jgi:hypothetical protein
MKVKKIMKTTFDKFINSNPKEKALFDKEYNEFLLSEFVLKKYEEIIGKRELYNSLEIGLKNFKDGNTLSEEEMDKSLDSM